MKLYFAAMETAHSYGYNEFLETDNVFGSYYYLKKVESMFNGTQARPLNAKTHKGIITIDSGAHSFFGFTGQSVVNTNNNKKGEMPDPQEYFDRYLAWIEANYENADYFVELDLQDIVGTEKIWEWREQYKKSKVFDKIITVHHSSDDHKHFTDLLKYTESKYIGLEGLRGGEIKLPYMKCLKEAYDAKVKVHGFALTNQKITSKYPFYSVDSSSWTAVNRYGVVFRWDKKNCKMKQGRTDKNNFFKHNFKLNQATGFRSRDDQFMKLSEAQKEFRQMEDYLTKLWTKRGVDWHGRVD